MASGKQSRSRKLVVRQKRVWISKLSLLIAISVVVAILVVAEAAYYLGMKHGSESRFDRGGGKSTRVEHRAGW